MEKTQFWKKSLSTSIAAAPLGLFIFILAYYIFGRGNTVAGAYILQELSQLKPHWPDFNLIAAQDLQVKIHLYSSLFVIALTLFQVFGKKGKTMHRILGWLWVSIMAIVAISSIFIRDLNNGGFSLIHIFTIITLISLPKIIYHARKHNVTAHKNAAMGLVYGGLIIAGAFTFLPGRLMWNIFFN